MKLADIAMAYAEFQECSPADANKKPAITTMRLDAYQVNRKIKGVEKGCIKAKTDA